MKWNVADKANCLKYVRKVSYTSAILEDRLDWDDFNGIFCKGIFKYSLITAVKNLLSSEESSKESNLMINLIVARIKNIW